MSDGMNKVILLGNIGADPELRFTGSGIAVLNFRMATNESYVDRNKELQERTEWHTVVIWGARAEALAKILSRGACVLVEGGLRTSSYEKDGTKRYKTEVHAREICLTGRRPPASELNAIAAAGAAAVAAAAGGDADAGLPLGARLGRNGSAPLKTPQDHLDELPY